MSESGNTMEAIIEDIQDVIVQLHNIMLTRPTCLRPYSLPSPQTCSHLSSRVIFVTKIEEAERAMLQAHNEAIRIKNNW